MIWSGSLVPAKTFRAITPAMMSPKIAASVATGNTEKPDSLPHAENPSSPNFQKLRKEKTRVTAPDAMMMICAVVGLPFTSRLLGVGCSHCAPQT